MGKKSNNPEEVGWTPEEVIQLGQECLIFKFIEYNRLKNKPEEWWERWWKDYREGATNVFLDQLEEKHGPLTDKVRQRIRTACPTELKKWSIRILKSNSLDDLFKP